VAKLYARLPKGGTGIVAAATGTDGQIRVRWSQLKHSCFPHLFDSNLCPFYITADLGQGRENDMLHRQHC